MTESDLLAAVRPVAEAFDALGVRYYVAGSLASSTHGVARGSLDVDIVAELEPRHVDAFADMVAGAYYVPIDRMRVAVADRRSFNLIHVATMFKADVFVAKGRPFDRQAADRARPQPLGGIPDAPRLPVGSPEEPPSDNGGTSSGF